MKYNRSSKKMIQKEQCDVAVVGGGIAGVMAAAAAAKTGAETVLVESAAFLGGVVTMGPLEALMTPDDSRGPVIAGIAQEFLEFLGELDPRAVPVPDTVGYCATVVPYDPETMKFALMEFLHRYRVKVLTETVLTDLRMENGQIRCLELQTKNGQIKLSCKAVVDASGSGYVGYLAGNDVMLGDENGQSQPVTVLCRMGGVDIEDLKAYVMENADQFQTMGDRKLDPNEGPIHLWGFSGTLREGYDSGALSLLRNEIHVMESVHSGEVIVNYSRINTDPMSVACLAEAQRQGMQQVYELLAWFKKKIPAFTNAYIVQTGYAGIRESGRVVGKRILTRADILGDIPCRDSVAMGAFPIDIHAADSGMKYERIVNGYHISQECLMAESVENLFLAGRCISADYEAHGSCRISMTCMSTGHAAGVMAAVWAGMPEKWKYEDVASILLSQGAIL